MTASSLCMYDRFTPKRDYMRFCLCMPREASGEVRNETLCFKLARRDFFLCDFSIVGSSVGGWADCKNRRYISDTQLTFIALSLGTSGTLRGLDKDTAKHVNVSGESRTSQRNVLPHHRGLQNAESEREYCCQRMNRKKVSFTNESFFATSGDKLHYYAFVTEHSKHNVMMQGECWL